MAGDDRADFSAHFWGERHVGFTALHANMKAGQTCVKDFSEAVKERVMIEEEYNKNLAKSFGKITAYATNREHNANKFWLLAKNSIEMANQSHGQLHLSLQELLKETHNYAEELHKMQRDLKHKPTFDAVNLMQTTTTCLQKSKETYHVRCVDVERVKQEANASAKEIAKVEMKRQKARDEYKMYIDKYKVVAKDFRTKVTASAKVYQTHETAYLTKMRQLFASLAKSYQESHQLQADVFAELHASTQKTSIDQLLMQFCNDKGSRTQAPDSVEMEEPDLSTLRAGASGSLGGKSPKMPKTGMSTGQLAASSANHSGASPAIFGLHSSSTSSIPTPKSSKNGAVVTVDVTHPSPKDANLISLSPTDEHASAPPPLPTMAPPLTLDTLIPTTITIPAKSPAPSTSTDSQSVGGESVATNDSATSKPRLNLSSLLPGRRHKSSDEPTPSPTLQSTPTQEKSDHSLGGFLKKRKEKRSKSAGKKESKSSPMVISDQQASPAATITDETRSETSSRSDDKATAPSMATIDEEGYTIRPLAERMPNRYRAAQASSSSESDSSEDDATTSKLKQLKINPVDTEPSGSEKASDTGSINASVDELRDVVGKMSLRNRSGSNASPSDKTDPWGGTTDVRQPLRAALTGDGTASITIYHNRVTVAKTRGLPPRQPLVASLTGGTIRARPRAQTPTNVFAPANVNSQTLVARNSRSASTADAGDRSFYRADSISSLADLSHGSSMRAAISMSSLAAGDAIPVAMAISETMHAWFTHNTPSKDAAPDGKSVSTPTKCRVRVFGSVFVSFPTKCVPLIATAARKISNSSALSNHTNEAEEGTGVAPPLEPLSFNLTGAARVSALIPNRQVLSSDALSAFASSETHSFTFDSVALSAYLNKEQKLKPSAPFFNVEVLRYEVRQPQPLLELQAYWKCADVQTDVRVDYTLNPQVDIDAPLLNLQFSTQLMKAPLNVIAKPDAKWSTTNTGLTWSITELSKRSGDIAGSLKARVTNSSAQKSALVASTAPQSSPTSASNAAQAMHVKFSINDATVSGANIQLVGESYRLSLLKRNIRTGKYFADPICRS